MDIDTLATRGHLINEEEKAARDAKTEFAIAEFEDNFDELFTRVENGEILTIIHDTGLRVLMVPATQCQIGSTHRKGLNSERDV
jgi:antitoxin (DNA-binding transcriptional repressor) of toxin-antitoxin stability system